MSDEASNPGHPSAIEEYYRFTAQHTQQVLQQLFIKYFLALFCEKKDTMMKDGKKDKRLNVAHKMLYRITKVYA